MRDNPPSPPHLNDVVFGGRLICAFRAAYPTFAKLIHTQYSKNHWDGGERGDKSPVWFFALENLLWKNGVKMDLSHKFILPLYMKMKKNEIIPK